MNSTVTLREVTRENLIAVLTLEVAETQKDLIASNAVSIAQAHFYPETSWFRAIYADETPVGFVMLEDEPAKASYTLWRFMIDERFQKQGFGRRALALVVEHVRTRPGAKVLMTSCIDKPGSAQPFYEKFGFIPNGEKEGDELIMRYAL